MIIEPLSAFSDNYIWLVHDAADAFVVDPGDDEPVRRALRERRLRLRAILLTHHHADHVGGVQALRPLLDGEVYGPAGEMLPEPCLPLCEGDRVELPGLSLRVLDVPGHTAGHIAYVGTPAGHDDPVLFCGDTLFSAGCGRLFEGTPAQMAASLAKLAGLPGRTRVCCAHEYTLSNLHFAQAVEPANDAIAQHLRWCQGERAAGRPTLPSRIELERRINPFLRCAEPEVARTVAARGEPAGDAVQVLGALREWKNGFR